MHSRQRGTSLTLRRAATTHTVRREESLAARVPALTLVRMLASASRCALLYPLLHPTLWLWVGPCWLSLWRAALFLPTRRPPRQPRWHKEDDLKRRLAEVWAAQKTLQNHASGGMHFKSEVSNLETSDLRCNFSLAWLLLLLCRPQPSHSTVSHHRRSGS